jgi:hypothetical protein
LKGKRDGNKADWIGFIIGNDLCPAEVVGGKSLTNLH